MADISLKEAKALEKLSWNFGLDETHCMIEPEFPQFWIDDALEALGRAILSKFKKFESHPMTE